MDKVVLISGGNRGIGFATVKAFVEKGYRVILGARKEEAGRDAIKKLGNPDNLYFCPLDISRDDSVEAMRNYIEENFGRVDVIINNAAINYDSWQRVLDADLDEVIDTLNVNLLGAWRVVKVLLPLMEKNNFGRIVNISSGAGAWSSLTGATPAYTMSKLSLNALTVMLSNEIKNENIHINSLCPGWVKTDMGGSAAPKSPDAAALDILDLVENRDYHGKFIREGRVISF